MRIFALSPSWTHVVYVEHILAPCSNYVLPMLAYVCLGWPELNLCWRTLAYVGPMLPYVIPMLRHLGRYAEHLLGICWLSWAYVGSMLRNLCSQTSSATTFFAVSFPLSETVEHKPSPCLAGARLSGVSLINQFEGGGGGGLN